MWLKKGIKMKEYIETTEYWTIEGKYVYAADDFYWGSTINIYDKEIANSTYNESKSNYAITRLIHHITSRKIIRENINE